MPTTGKGARVRDPACDPLFERISQPIIQNLERLGVRAKVRTVDPAQYQNRIQEFDFDVTQGGFGQSESPGNEQREFWGSASADVQASRNTIGIKDPVIDELIELIIAAETRESLIARTHALDRVLLWHHFVIPQWHLPADRIAYWDKFSPPCRKAEIRRRFQHLVDRFRKGLGPGRQEDELARICSLTSFGDCC